MYKEMRIKKTSDVYQVACSTTKILSSYNEVTLLAIGQPALAIMVKVMAKLNEMHKDWKIIAEPISCKSTDSAFKEGTIRYGFKVRRSDILQDPNRQTDTKVIKIDDLELFPSTIDEMTSNGCEFITSIPVVIAGTTVSMYLVFSC